MSAPGDARAAPGAKDGAQERDEPAVTAPQGWQVIERHPAAEAGRTGAPRTLVEGDLERPERATTWSQTGIAQADALYQGEESEGVRVTLHDAEGRLRVVYSLLAGQRHGAESHFDGRGHLSRVLPWVDGELHGTELHFDERGRMTAAVTWRRGKREGLHVSFGPDEQIASTLRYTNDLPAGELIRYHLDGKDAGKKASVVPVFNTVPHGVEQRFDGRGVKREELTWDYGRMQGVVRTWDQHGRLIAEVEHVDGVAHGKETLYHPLPKGANPDLAPQVRLEAIRVAGQRQGTVRIYAADGTLQQELPYDAGVLDGVERRQERDPLTGELMLGLYTWQRGKLQATARTAWPDDRPRSTLTLDDKGKRHGKEVVYARAAAGGAPVKHPAGGDQPTGKDQRVTMRIPWVHGQISGDLEILDDETGTRVVEVVPHRNGKRHGLAQVFYPSGERQAAFRYDNGEPVGARKSFYENGKLMVDAPWGDTEGEQFELRWHDNGKLWMRIRMVNGVRQGMTEIYTKKGMRWADVPYEEGRKHGDEVRYVRGKRYTQYRWVRGELQGEPLFYYRGQTYTQAQIKRILASRRAAARRARSLGDRHRVVTDWYDREAGVARADLYFDKARGQWLERLWYRDGQLWMEAPLTGRDGVRQGIAQYYSEAGELAAEVPFVQGVRHGAEVRFYANGATKMQRTFVEGEPRGLVKAYSERGHLAATYPTGEKKARGMEVLYNEDGSWRMAVPMVGGQRHGVATFYGEKGHRTSQVTYFEGKREGVEVRYHTRGRTALVVPVEQGERHGLAMMYDTAGDAFGAVRYEKGKREGDELRFERDGKPRKVRRWRAGREVDTQSGGAGSTRPGAPAGKGDAAAPAGGETAPSKGTATSPEKQGGAPEATRQDETGDDADEQASAPRPPPSVDEQAADPGAPQSTDEG